MTRTAEEMVADLDGGPWQEWVAACFPHVFTRPVGWFHVPVWDHVWSATADAAPVPPSIVLSVFRGGAKSSTAEAAVVALLASKRRKYCVYVSGTQNAADDHVGSLAGLAMGSSALGVWHPEMGSAYLDDKARQSRWNAKRVEFGNGAVVDAAGLDTKIRGKKTGEMRPDLIVLDDIDEPTDSARVTARKLARLDGILGGGAPAAGTLVLFIQNPLARDSIMSQVLDHRVDILADRITVGPVPMIANATYDPDENGKPVLDGDPTWPEVWPLEAARADMARMGVRGYRRENQHDTDQDVDGALLTTAAFRHEPVSPADCEKVIVSVDPAITSKPGSDETGIVGVGRVHHELWAVLDDQSGRYSVSTWPKVVDQMACNLLASEVLVEANQGGDQNLASIERAQADRFAALQQVIDGIHHDPSIPDDMRADLLTDAQTRLDTAHQYRVRLVWATEPKEIRASRPAARYQEGQVIHARQFLALETQWTTWVPGVSKDSPNNLDAEVHGLIDLGCLPVVSSISFSNAGADRDFAVH